MKHLFLPLVLVLTLAGVLQADMSELKKRAFSASKVKAEQGDANAQFSLGGIYYQGIVAEKDYAKAIEWYTKAAEQGHTEAQYNLGYMYYDGRGVSVDYAKAYHWFELAAEDDDVKAQLYLARMNYEGKGVDQNYDKAFQLYKKVADETNHAKAQERVGHMFRRGLGIARNKEMAKYYLEKASQQSCGEAQYELGDMYLSENVQSPEAKQLMQEAYLNGIPKAKEVMDEHNWEPIQDTRSMPEE